MTRHRAIKCGTAQFSASSILEPRPAGDRQVRRSWKLARQRWHGRGRHTIG